VVSLESLVVVFLAGLATALATGLGAVPLIFLEEVSDRLNIALWGLASGIMIAASTLGLLTEGWQQSEPWAPGLEYGLSVPGATLVPLAVGALVGVGLVVLARTLLEEEGPVVGQLGGADSQRLILILGILTIHSFPEGVAVGVSFADLTLTEGLPIGGLTIPALAIFMTLAISVHNLPEGVAVAIPLRARGARPRALVFWAVFSSLPQPIGAVLAYAFVESARGLLPLGYGFAAGAMVLLVVLEFLPEAISLGEGLPDRGYPALGGGFLGGCLLMLPLVWL
jgi:ZIP family zinc transporter